MKLRKKSLLVSAGLLVCLGSLPASAQQVTCVREPIEVATVRGEGLAELMPTIGFACSGGTPQTQLTFDLDIFLSVEIANPVIGPGSNDIDVVLVVSGPTAAGAGEEKLPSPSQGNPIIEVVQCGRNPNLNRALICRDVPYQGFSSTYGLQRLRARGNSTMRPGDIVSAAQFSGGINQTLFDDILLARRPNVSLEGLYVPADPGQPQAIIVGERGNPRTLLKRFETAPGFPGVPAQDDPLINYNTESGFIPDPSGPFGPADSGTRLVIQIDQPEGLDATINLPACVDSKTTPGFGLRGFFDYEPDFSGGTPANECPGVVTMAPDGTFVYEAVGDPGVTGADMLDEFDFTIRADCGDFGNLSAEDVNGRVFLAPLEGGLPLAPLVEAGKEQFVGVLPLFVFLLDPVIFSAPVPQFCEVPQINIQIPDGGIVNGAGFQPGPLAPGSIVSVFGTGLAGGMQAAANSIPLPTVIEGVTVEVDGVPAPLFFASEPQINFQIPNAPIQPPLTEEGGSKNQANTVTVVVKHSGAESNPAEVEIAAHSPAIFTADFGAGRAIAFDGVDGALAHPVGSFPGSEPIQHGEVMTIFANGLGPTNPPFEIGDDSLDDQGNFVRRDTVTIPQVTIGGVDAPVTFSGMSPQFVAVYQVNVTVSAQTPIGDQVPLVIEIGGKRSRDDVTVAVSE